MSTGTVPSSTQAIDEEVEQLLASGGSLPECVRFQEAFEMYREGIIPNKSGAAIVAEMKRTTFGYRTRGRRSAEDYHKSRRLLKEEEEQLLIWQCDILQRTGFPLSVKDVTSLAEMILRKREPTATISPRWIDRSFYKQHPEVKARWSQQLDRIRALQGNNFAALEAFFEAVRDLTK